MEEDGETARRRGWLAAGGVIAAVVLMLGGYKASRHWSSQQAAAEAAEPVETVRAIPARIGSFAPDARSVGTVVATETVELRSELAGRIVQVGFRSGAIVPRGALLVRFDSEEERARLAAQTARAAIASKNLGRANELRKRGFITEAQVDLLLSESSAARSEAAAIRAVIAKKEIRAPFTGRAGIHDLHPGQYLDEGSRLTTLQGIEPVRHVDFTLPANAAAQVPVGSTVQVAGPGLPSGGIAARVTARDSSATDARLVKYRVSVPIAPDRLLPGSFVDVSVGLGRPVPTVLVPRTAVVERPHAAHVFLLSAEAGGALRARQRIVRLGAVRGEEVAVVSGLKGGERIVAEGAFKLRDGMTVRAIPHATAAATR